MNKKGFIEIFSMILMLFGVGIISTPYMYMGVQNNAKLQVAEVLAKEVRDKAEVYYAEFSDYPKNAAVLRNPVDDSGNTLMTAKLSKKAEQALVDGYPKKPGQIGYRVCRNNNQITGAKIYYWNNKIKNYSKNPVVAGDCQ